MTVACVVGKTQFLPLLTTLKGKKKMDSELGLQGPAVLIEQHTDSHTVVSFQTFTHGQRHPSFAPPPSCPRSPGSHVIFFLRVLFWWGSIPPQDVTRSLQLQRSGGGGLRRRDASCLIPLPPQKGFNPSPAVPVRGPVLKGSLRVYPTCQPSASCWCRLQGWG